MNTYAECLRLAKGRHLKARRVYIRDRRWSDEDWVRAWERGLADEVETAAKEQQR